MTDGADSSAVRPLRRAVPLLDGPLASSGAAPEPVRARPVDPAPADAIGADATPTTPEPDRPGLAVSTAVTPEPTDAAPAEAKPADAVTANVGLSDAVPGDAKRADAVPGDEGRAGAGSGDPEATEAGAATGDPETKTDGATGDTTTPGPDGATTGDATPAGAATRGRRTRVPFAHALRRFPPARQIPAATTRAVRSWSRGGSGRLVLPAMLILALIAAAGLAGGVLIPATSHVPPSRAGNAGGPNPDLTAPPTGPDGSVVPSDGAGPLPTGGLPGALPATARPADVLTGWAQQTSARTGVAPLAMEAYGYAELVLAQTRPACKLSWTTLAAIGYVESRHGTANGAQLDAKGASTPKIIGEPLDGQGNRMRIMDTDRGALDGDVTYDRAVGPMQFIPTTWQESGVDADNDGVKNPQDLDDAALAAGNYLCKGTRNLSVIEDWWNAILSYNNLHVYAQDVFNKANEYGANSRA
ncbi:lytic murein transglycosylase [Micromonospora sp. NBC_01699]|uniref:lytic transglycosylase domain-containing protein n=1 Tax=Micromonospora sp. NBC_01699 TaxID=2975984 RepID=UPI002E295E00|nr:lytic murein transglycosylase [Micromonospora sp. NBC_01699]